MARTRTTGFEIGIHNAAVYGDGAVTGTVTFQSATKVRSGSNSAKCDSGAGNATAFHAWRPTTLTLGVGTYHRMFFNFDQLPGSTVKIMAGLTSASGVVCSARLTSAGKLQLFNDVAGTQIGSDSAATIAINTWYEIEMYMLVGTGAVDATALRLDGVLVASGSALALSDTASGIWRNGWVDAPGASKVVYLDDGAINDDTSEQQNSWAGLHGSRLKVVLLRPTSDSQDGTWTGGSGGTGNLSDAVDNTPPLGTATESDTTQIESIDDTGDNAADEYRVNMTTYAAAGIVAADTIILVQTVIDHGEDVTAGSKTGKYAINSNPTQSGTDTFTFGADSGALGTWPTNWAANHGTAIHYPSVTLGTAPVMAVRKTDTGVRVASVDFMGIYVEYSTPPALAFCESGTDATQDLKHWNSTSGTVTSDITVPRTGPRAIKCDSAVGNLAAYCQRNGIMADAGRQFTLAIRFVNFPLSTDTPVMQVLTSGNVVVVDVRVSSGGVLKIYDGLAQEGLNGSTLSLNTWYRLCLSYTITSASVNELRLYKDGVSDISVTNATLVNVGSDRIRAGWAATPGASLVCFVDDVAVFGKTDLTDTGNVAVTAKLPATENVNNFDTAIGTARSASDWNNVDEQPLSETNGWQHAATTVVEESYGVQAASAGDVDITGLTLKGHCVYVWAKAGAADVGAKLIDQSYRKYASLTGTSAMVYQYCDDTTYPSDAAAVGMQSTGSANDTFFYEGGILIVYEPTVAGGRTTKNTDPYFHGVKHGVSFRMTHGIGVG